MKIDIVKHDVIDIPVRSLYSSLISKFKVNSEKSAKDFVNHIHTDICEIIGDYTHCNVEEIDEDQEYAIKVGLLIYFFAEYDYLNPDEYLELV